MVEDGMPERGHPARVETGPTFHIRLHFQLFPMVGKNGANFPMIGKFFRRFSNDWKIFSGRRKGRKEGGRVVKDKQDKGGQVCGRDEGGERKGIYMNG